jgi:hypothetical protein
MPDEVAVFVSIGTITEERVDRLLELLRVQAAIAAVSSDGIAADGSAPTAEAMQSALEAADIVLDVADAADELPDRPAVAQARKVGRAIICIAFDDNGAAEATGDDLITLSQSQMPEQVAALARALAIAMVRLGPADFRQPASPDQLARDCVEAWRRELRIGETTTAVNVPSTPPPPPPPSVDEDVEFTVYRPRAIQRDRWYTMLAFAHLSARRPDAAADAPDPMEEVRRQALLILDGQSDAYSNSTNESAIGIPREQELTFAPNVAGIEFNPPSRRFLWQETVHREEFRLRASRTVADQLLRGRLTVLLGTVIVADVNLSFQLTSGAEDTSPTPTTANHYRSIFASYAHEDADVVRQFGVIAAATGDRLLRDVVELRSGEVWNPRLLDLIGRADIFQLFWSWNSMRSRYVRQEWEYALSLSRANFVRPVYWQSPMPRDPSAGLPPPLLSRLHFYSLSALAPTSLPSPAIADGVAELPWGPPGVRAAPATPTVRAPYAQPANANYSFGPAPAARVPTRRAGASVRLLLLLIFIVVLLATLAVVFSAGSPQP